MARRHDHLERARREEERKMLASRWEEQQVTDKAAWEAEQLSLRASLKEGRAHDLQEKVRFGRTTSCKEAWATAGSWRPSRPSLSAQTCWRT